jgi:MSHA pilin protein MshD
MRIKQKKLHIKARGFTLIELVVGIVVMAIALTFMINIFFSNPGRSVEPLLQIRAAEFGQALMEEIVSKKFDHTTPLGGSPACIVCTASNQLGPEDGGGSPARTNDGEVSREVFDDVDDYNIYCGDETGNTGWPVRDAFGNTPIDFDNFRMRVCVGYDGDLNGTINEGSAGDINAKLITVDVFAPQVGGLGDAIRFNSYKGNY